MPNNTPPTFYVRDRNAKDLQQNKTHQGEQRKRRRKRRKLPDDDSHKQVLHVVGFAKFVPLIGSVGE